MSSGLDDILPEKCRLCGSKKNLISLFSGKAKEKRDYIRKLIHDLVNITIEYDDVISTRVCIVCCIYIYNFYNFKELAKTVELTLQEPPSRQKEKTPKKNKKKINIVAVKDILLPKYEELQTNLLDWLTAKQMDVTNNEDVEKIVDNFPTENKCTEDKTVLTDTLSVCSKSVDVRVSTRENTCQTEKEVSSKDEAIQCVINFQTTTETTFTQTEIDFTTIKFTQTDSAPVKDSSTVCDLRDVGCRSTGTEKSSFMTALSLDRSDSIKDLSIYSPNGKGKMTRSRSSSNVTTPPRKVIIFDANDKRSEEKCTQTEFLSSQNGLCNGLLVPSMPTDSANLKTVTLNIITDKSGLNNFKNEEVSPPNNGAMTLFRADIQPIPKTSELLSPSSSTLLKVENKHHVVNVCELCDKVTYTKKEKNAHKRDHLQCPICKRKFKSMYQASSHTKLCRMDKPETVKINKISDTLYVHLCKLDDDNSLRKLYPVAFEQLSNMIKMKHFS